jgi:hypothetical protein
VTRVELPSSHTKQPQSENIACPSNILSLLLICNHEIYLGLLGAHFAYLKPRRRWDSSNRHLTVHIKSWPEKQGCLACYVRARGQRCWGCNYFDRTRVHVTIKWGCLDVLARDLRIRGQLEEFPFLANELRPCVQGALHQATLHLWVAHCRVWYMPIEK